MENISKETKDSAVITVKEKTSRWLSMVKAYYYDLNFFKQKVEEKITSNPVEEQIKQDVLLNIKTMMDKVQEEVIKDLAKQEELLDSSIANDSKGGLSEVTRSILEKLEAIENAIVSVKEMTMDFLNREQFGLRHGFPVSYQNQ